MVVARKRKSLFGIPSMMMNFAGGAQAPASSGAIGARQHRAKGLPLPGSQSPQRPRGGLGGPPKRNWGRTAALAMSALSELDPANRGSTMYMRDRFDESDARRAAAAEDQRRQDALARYTEGLSPEMAELAQLAPDAFLKAKVEQSFAQPEGPSYADILARERFEYEKTQDANAPELTPYQAEQLRLAQERLDFQRNKPDQNGITIGADGTIQIGGPSGAATSRQMAGQDATQMADARERANALQPVLNTMYAARAELLGPDGVEGTEDDLDTGSFAPLVQMGRRFLPGEQRDETRYDNLDALSKEFGIEKLAGIGGNDTERELLTAIQTGPNIGAQEGSNLSRINRQIGVFEFIGESRRNFMARWQADHGSLSRVANKGPYQGLTFDEALSVFQREEAQRQGLLGAAQSGQSAPDSSVGITEQQGDLTPEEYQELLALRLEVGGG